MTIGHRTSCSRRSVETKEVCASVLSINIRESMCGGAQLLSFMSNPGQDVTQLSLMLHGKLLS